MKTAQVNTTREKLGDGILASTGFLIGVLIASLGICTLFTIIFAAMKATDNLEWSWFSWGFSGAVFVLVPWLVYIAVPITCMLIFGAKVRGNPEEVAAQIAEAKKLAENYFNAFLVGKTTREELRQALAENHADLVPHAFEKFDQLKATYDGRVAYRSSQQAEQHGYANFLPLKTDYVVVGSPATDLQKHYDHGKQYEKQLDGPTHVVISSRDFGRLTMKYGVDPGKENELDGVERDIAFHPIGLATPQVDKVWKFKVTGTRLKRQISASQVTPTPAKS